MTSTKSMTGAQVATISALLQGEKMAVGLIRMLTIACAFFLSGSAAADQDSRILLYVGDYLWVVPKPTAEHRIDFFDTQPTVQDPHPSAVFHPSAPVKLKVLSFVRLSPLLGLVTLQFPDGKVRYANSAPVGMDLNNYEMLNSQSPQQQATQKKLDRELEKKARSVSGVQIGMTKQQVLDSSWGKPRSVNTTTTVSGSREQWVYKPGNYLYFENNVLTAIQN